MLHAWKLWPSRGWRPYSRTQSRLDAQPHWLPRVAAALLWAAVAATAVLWLLHLPSLQPAPSAEVAAPAAPVPATDAVARALGHAAVQAAAPVLAQRFELRGVIASASGQGSALIVVDGQPPRAFVQGQTVVDGWRLQTLDKQSVRLGPGSGSGAGTGAAAADAGLQLRLPSKP